jgi:hypothetical protein
MPPILLFPPKTPAEIRKLEFDVAADLGAAGINAGTLTVVVTVAYAAGATDPAPMNILTATPHSIVGTKIYIWVDTGVAGVDYEFSLTFQTDEATPRTIETFARLPVRSRT